MALQMSDPEFWFGLFYVACFILGVVMFIIVLFDRPGGGT